MMDPDVDKRLALLEQTSDNLRSEVRDLTDRDSDTRRIESELKHLKADKADVTEVVKRVDSVEADLKVARTVAFVLGLGGAVLAGLLWTAGNRIAEVQTQASMLSNQMAQMDQNLDTAQASAVATVDRAAKTHSTALMKHANALQAGLAYQLTEKLTVSVFQFCRGQKEGGCLPLKPSGCGNATDIATKLCGAAKTNLQLLVDRGSGDRCGYHLYTVSCLSAE